MKNNLKLRETNKLKNKQKHTRSIKRDITADTIELLTPVPVAVLNVLSR